MATRLSKTPMADWRQMMRLSLIRSGALIAAGALALFALFYAVSLLSYTAVDHAFNSASDSVSGNWMGQLGAYFADGSLFLFGVPAIFLVPLLLVFARRLWRDVPQPTWKRQLLICVIGMLLMGFGMSHWQHGTVVGLPAGWGGVFALLADNGAMALLEKAGENWRALIRVVLIVGSILGGFTLVLRSLELERPLFRIPAIPLPSFGGGRKVDEDGAVDTAKPAPKPAPEPPARPTVEPKTRPPLEIKDRPSAAPKASFATGARQDDFFGSYKLPSIELLDPPQPSTAPKLDKAALEQNARFLESVLDDFSVKGEVTAVRPGPVVTMYELEPAPGVKASRVIQLAEDIARNMSALSARVSTIPGRTVMGIELPNHNREAVVFHEMIGSTAFADQKGQLPIILGKNI